MEKNMLEWIYSGTGNGKDTNTALLKCLQLSTWQHTDGLWLRLSICVSCLLPLLLVNYVHGVLGIPVEHFVMFCETLLMNKSHSVHTHTKTLHVRWSVRTRCFMVNVAVKYIWGQMEETDLHPLIDQHLARLQNHQQTVSKHVCIIIICVPLLQVFRGVYLRVAVHVWARAIKEETGSLRHPQLHPSPWDSRKKKPHTRAHARPKVNEHAAPCVFCTKWQRRVMWCMCRSLRRAPSSFLLAWSGKRVNCCFPRWDTWEFVFPFGFGITLFAGKK